MIKVLMFLGVMLFISCQKPSQEETFDSLNLKSNPSKLEICHYDTDSSEWKIISVSEKAYLNGHSKHGDQIIQDSDEDGFYAFNSCGVMGTKNKFDCNDGDNLIYPGVREICDNNLDDDCDGLVDYNDDECVPSNEGLLTVTFEDGTVIYVHPNDQLAADLFSNRENGALMEWSDPHKGVGSADDFLAPPISNTLILADNDGRLNTLNLINNTGEWLTEDGSPYPYAALICDNLVYNGYNDWYLPSIGELREIFKQIGKQSESNFALSEDFNNSFYWSSTAIGLAYYGGGGLGVIFEASANIGRVEEGVVKNAGAVPRPPDLGRCRCVRRDSPNPPDIPVDL